MFFFLPMSPPYSFPLLHPSHILHMPFTEPLSVKLSFSSAPFTHSSDPAKTQTWVPLPKPTSSSQTSVSPKKLHWNTLLTQFTQHKPQETAFCLKKQLNFLPSHRYSSREWGSYLCRCIPQTGSSCPLSFHFNNACSNGSQARAIWESQPPLRGRCTNTSIVPLPKSLPLMVTPCVTQPQQHSSALTQLDINSCLWSCWHNTHATDTTGTNTHNYNSVCIVSKNIYVQHEQQQKRLPVGTELSIQRALHNTSRHIEFHKCSQICNYCQGNSDIPIWLALFGTFYYLLKMYKRT